MGVPLRPLHPASRHAVLTSVLVPRRRRWLWFAMAALLLRPAPAGAQELEYQVKAAFLLNFARFTEWAPTAFADPEAPLIVCTFAENPFGDTLANTLANERAAGHPLLAKTIATAADVPQCHLLFIPRAQTRHTTEIAAARGNRAIVLIGEDEGFLAAGGDINLTIEQGRVRFVIDPQRATHGNVRFSSHLLRLAKNAGQVVP
jgi:hypothetical protein